VISQAINLISKPSKRISNRSLNCKSPRKITYLRNWTKWLKSFITDTKRIMILFSRIKTRGVSLGELILLIFPQNRKRSSL
jgi:hypothetical protein